MPLLYIFTDFRFLLFYSTEELQLISGSYKIMLRIINLIIGVAIKIVGKETYGLHHGKQSDSIRQ